MVEIVLLCCSTTLYLQAFSMTVKLKKPIKKDDFMVLFIKYICEIIYIRTNGVCERLKNASKGWNT